MSAFTLNPKAVKSIVEALEILSLTTQFSGFEAKGNYSDDLGAFPLIRETFKAYFRPLPSPMCQLVTLAQTHPLPLE